MKLTIEEKQMLGRVLLERRAGLTQEKLCARSGIGIRTLQRAEKGDGISGENLDALCSIFKCSADDLIRETRARGVPSPELRLKFDEVESSNQLIAHLLRVKGMLHIGPEGEDPFNEHIGGFIGNLKSALDDLPAKRKAIDPATNDQAGYVLAYSKKMGFRLFACHYREELTHEGKLIRNPTTLIIATTQADARVKKTSKGFILDYMVDSRRQSLARILNANLTPYAWMQDQLISRSNGAERVKAALEKIHSSIQRRKK